MTSKCGINVELYFESIPVGVLYVSLTLHSHSIVMHWDLLEYLVETLRKAIYLNDDL